GDPDQHSARGLGRSVGAPRRTPKRAPLRRGPRRHRPRADERERPLALASSLPGRAAHRQRHRADAESDGGDRREERARRPARRGAAVLREPYSFRPNGTVSISCSSACGGNFSLRTRSSMQAASGVPANGPWTWASLTFPVFTITNFTGTWT